MNLIFISKLIPVNVLFQINISFRIARIFNLLPSHIRNVNADNVDSFKKSLDSFLTNIPDQPTIAGMGRAAESNSLLHQIPLFMLNNSFVL
jgi:hypothetical protein